MDLFDNYFRTLKILLPKDQRDDVIRELTEEMRSQAAEMETRLGRPLSADEQAAILSQYGHPLLTAARYQPQRYLVGPVVFPCYWLVLRVTIGLVVAGHLIGGAVLLASGAPVAQIGEVFAALAATLLKVVGWITVLAVAADWWLARSQVLERWNPRAPFPPVLRRVVGHTGPQASERSAVGASVSGFAFVVLLSAWWLLGLKFPYLFFGPGANDLSWGAAMDRLFPVLAVAQVIMLAGHFLRLTRTHSARLARFTGAAWLIAGWFFIYFVATSDHQWIVWHGAAQARARASIVAEIAGQALSLADFVNYIVSAAFLLAAAAGVLHSVRSLLRWLSRGHRPAHA